MPEQTIAVDAGAVRTWLADLGIPAVAPLRFQRIGLGQSNLTYLVTDAADARWVLRRPPLGHILASAHDVVREARILSALAGTGVPVPRVHGSTTDARYAEVPLVLMDYVDGRTVDTMQVAEALTPSERGEIAAAMPDALAAVHAVDLERHGLHELAGRKPYAPRQLTRWARQLEQSKTRELPRLDDLTRRLSAAIPEQRDVTLVHGDFHLRNLMFHRDRPEIVAVLDWELSTLGDPLADMGTLLTYGPEPGETSGGDFAPSTLPGFPNRADMAKRYLDVTGRDPAALAFWHVLGLWKLAIIGEGVRRRALDRPDNAGAAGIPTAARIDAVIEQAVDLAHVAGI
ncbi:phosphotransferase family protein [Nocardia asteroides]|uniref:phosphotransferase family protein n=1 Tax=Nocardia asteroides TaxID=1824 RepID=UPI003658474C